MEQIKHVINKMPNGTEIEKRNCALIAFTLLTGARDSAIASMKLKHVDITEGRVYQDAREVKTKFSKTFTTFFFPVAEEILEIVVKWVSYLRDKKLWGNDDPLFPSTLIQVGPSCRFEAAGLKRKHWNTTTPIRKIFREAFEDAGLQYFNPHSFRSTLAQLGETICKTPEEFKAWSQNLGHEKVMTTFLNYGGVSYQRQREIIRDLAKPQKGIRKDADEIAEAVVKRLNNVQ
jgi:integrase